MGKITAGWTKTLETGCVSAGGGEGSHLCALWGVPVASRAWQSFRGLWLQAWGHSFCRVTRRAMQTQQVRGFLGQATALGTHRTKLDKVSSTTPIRWARVGLSSQAAGQAHMRSAGSREQSSNQSTPGVETVKNFSAHIMSIYQRNWETRR